MNELTVFTILTIAAMICFTAGYIFNSLKKISDPVAQQLHEILNSDLPYTEKAELSKKILKYLK